MCGIFGHLKTSEFDPQHSISALNTLAHRGPDQYGSWDDEEAFLGHRRLSILDTSINGQQPMVDPNSGVVITVNGEIYNFQKLKRQLVDKYDFKSNSDSEVVLFGYQEWGLKALLEKMDGMYAIVIYDRRKKKLYLVRDRVGIKPIVYGQLDGNLAWASELKALVSYYGPQRLVKDNTALYDFLTYKYIPTPKTLYSGIFNLPPAHYLEYDFSNRRTTVAKYWELSAVSSEISLSQAAETARQLISESVSEQLMSDVPLGFFLSGGLDSSTLVSSAHVKGERIRTYTLGFDEASHDESEKALSVATLYNTLHHTKIQTYENSRELLDRMDQWFDQPFGDVSAIPTFRVCEFIKKDCQVAISGDGGDELFGGYKRYFKFKEGDKNPRVAGAMLDQMMSSAQRLTQSPMLFSKFSEFKRRNLLGGLELYAKLANGLVRSEKKYYRELLEIPSDYDDYWYFREHYRPEVGPLKSLQYLDFHTYLHDQVLTKMDRVSMSVSLEARVPFLSLALIEFAFSLPENICYHNHQLKGLLKYSMENKLPSGLLTSGKKGFGLPVNSWKGEFTSEGSLQETLLKPYL